MRHKGSLFKVLVHRDRKVSNPMLINQGQGQLFLLIIFLTTKACLSTFEEFRDTVLDVSIMDSTVIQTGSIIATNSIMAYRTPGNCNLRKLHLPSDRYKVTSSWPQLHVPYTIDYCLVNTLNRPVQCWQGTRGLLVQQRLAYLKLTSYIVIPVIYYIS
jgi:hypothetical protein